MVSPTLQCSRCSFTGRPLRQQMAAPASARCRTPLAVTAKLSQAADFRGLSQEQIHEQVQAAKRELFDLRIKQRTKQVRLQCQSCKPLSHQHLHVTFTVRPSLHCCHVQEFKTSDFSKIKLKVRPSPSCQPKFTLRCWCHICTWSPALLNSFSLACRLPSC